MNELTALAQHLLKRFEQHAETFKDSQMCEDASIVAMDLQSAIRGMQALSLQEYRTGQKVNVPVPILKAVPR